MIEKFFKNYFQEIQELQRKVDLQSITKSYMQILKVKKNKGKILVFGNGANISNAAHFATDMTKNGKIETMALNDPNLITCFSNDYGFERWIEKTILYYGKKNDLVIFLSASGSSKNLVNAAKHCKKRKIKTISITGFKKNNALLKNSNYKIWINSNSYNLIEVLQATILSSFVDKKIGKLSYKSNL